MLISGDLKRDGGRVTGFAVDPGMTTGWASWSGNAAHFSRGDGGMGAFMADGSFSSGQVMCGHAAASGASGWAMELQGARHLWDLIWDQWRGVGSLWIVYEDFILRGGGRAVAGAGSARSGLSAVRVTSSLLAVVAGELDDMSYDSTGAAVAWSVCAGGAGVVTVDGRVNVLAQSAAMAKGFATDDRLRAWGMYRRSGAERHARDASRHLAVWSAGMRKSKL